MQPLRVQAADKVLVDFDTSCFSDIAIFLEILLVEDLQEGTSNRGNDLRYDVNINLEEAYKGLRKKC